MMQAAKPPPFYDTTFEHIAIEYLRKGGLSQDLITASNLLQCYNLKRINP